MLQKRDSVSHSTCDRGPYFATSSAASPNLGTQSFVRITANDDHVAAVMTEAQWRH